MGAEEVFFPSGQEGVLQLGQEEMPALRCPEIGHEQAVVAPRVAIPQGARCVPPPAVGLQPLPVVVRGSDSLQSIRIMGCLLLRHVDDFDAGGRLEGEEFVGNTRVRYDSLKRRRVVFP